MVLNMSSNLFEEMSFEEMYSFDGGGLLSDIWNGVCKAVTAGVAGAAAGAKIGAATCNPVGYVGAVIVGAV